MKKILFCVVIASSLLFQTSSGFAQKKNDTAPPVKSQNAPAPPQIDSVVLAVLIKSAVVALQQANATGNYGVLRDLGTPIFREKFDQTKSSVISGAGV
jgi:hypothetical protein